MPLGRPFLVVVTVPEFCNSTGAATAVFQLSPAGPRYLDDLYRSVILVQPLVTHGLHDFVYAHHMSAFETGLAWMRFDGHSYRQISTAIAYSGFDGPERMANEQARCAAARTKCNLIRWDYPD